MNIQHTRGPWCVGADLRAVIVDWRDANGNQSRDATTSNGWAKTVAKIPHGTWASVSEHVANARLMAAAPDFEAALIAVEMARLTDAAEDWERATALTDAAFAKARTPNEIGDEG